MIGIALSSSLRGGRERGSGATTTTDISESASLSTYVTAIVVGQAENSTIYIYIFTYSFARTEDITKNYSAEVVHLTMSNSSLILAV